MTTNNKLKLAQYLANEVVRRSEAVVTRAANFRQMAWNHSCTRCGHVCHLTQHAMGAHYRCDVAGCECANHHGVCKPQEVKANS